jgi:glutaminyl-tRNA synthetase
MCLNFELAFKELGVAPENRDVTFRYDDTNPEAESQEYIDSQVRMGT